MRNFSPKPEKSLTCIDGSRRPLFGHLAGRMFGLPNEELNICLEKQRTAGGRLGKILRDRKSLTREHIGQILQAQAQSTTAALEAELRQDVFPYPVFLSLCLPCHNEETNIEDTIDTACAVLPACVERWEVVVVNDGSQDRTGEIVARLAEEDYHVRLITHEQNRGYGAAITSGLRAARGDLVAFTDSDGQFSLLDLPRFLVCLQSCDVVVGYRARRADHLGRVFNAWAWNQLIRMTLGVRVRDLDCAFKLFRRETVERLSLTCTGACISAEILAQCVHNGLRIREIPVSHFARHDGTATGAAFKVILRAFRELPQLLKYRKPSFAGDTSLGGPLIAAASDRLAGPALDYARRKNGPPPSAGSRLPDDNSSPGQVRELPLTICMLAACPFPANHGTPGSIREMAESIAERGHDVHIVTYHFGEDIPVCGPKLHRIKALLRESSIIVGPTVRRPLYDLQMVFKTLEVIHRHRPAVLHAHGYEAALAAWLCRIVSGVPVVYSGHNTMADELPSYNFFRPRWVAVALAKFLDAFVPRRADRCLPHSENIAAFFRREKLQDRMEPIINFGIDVKQVIRGDGASVRARFGLGRGPVIAYTGVMNEFQRLDLLLEAMVTVVGHLPTAKLFIVATIPNAKFVEQFQQRAAELGIADHVVMTKPQRFDSVQELLAACDVTVVPRPQAPGFPIKLLNYMVVEKPCVLFASSASGLAHRENVFLAAPDTSAALAEALLDVLGDAELRRRLATGGYRFVCENHDRRLTARQLYNVYIRTLVDTGGPSRHFSLRLHVSRKSSRLLDQKLLTSHRSTPVIRKEMFSEVDADV